MIKHLLRSITLKLTLTFLAVSLVGVGLVAAIIWGTTSAAFDQFLIDRGKADMLAALTAYYSQNGSWDGISEALVQQAINAASNQGANQPGGGGAPPLPCALADQNGVIIVRAGPYQVGSAVSTDQLASGEAVMVAGKQVGTLLPTGGPPNRDPSSDRYLQRANQALLAAALISAVLAVLLGLTLARSLTRPVLDLTAAARAMASGQLTHQLPVRSRDELGELTATFNRMSADLQRSNELRRQITADIAHDLRTPLAVITGYLEGLRDGVLKPTPQRYDAMFNESRRLQRLVEDLRTLSLADAGELAINRQAVAPRDLLERLAQAFEQQAAQKEVQLALQAEADLPELWLDPERTEQVLANLVSNALRYTPAGGQITLRARRAGQSVCLVVQDTGAGMTSAVLDHAFERFYRGDPSRSGQDEESGLGLAIARSIIELHGGQIRAESAGPGQGSTFTISLPVRA